MEIKYRLGSLDRKGAKKDPRNYLFSSIKTATAVPGTFMEMVDNLKSFAGMRNQFYGDCTSQGGAGMKEYHEQKILSPHFLYNMIKKISGLYDVEGDYGINVMKALVKYGICEEYLFPTVPATSWLKYVKMEPSAQAYANALLHKGRTYWEVNEDSYAEYQRAMSVFKTPVCCSMEVFQNYLNCTASGILPLPSGDFLGGHFIAAVGYDTVGIWFKNSWGKNWGNGGYFCIPYADWNKHRISNCFVLLDLNKDMIYRINKTDGEQYLLDDNLMIGFNIADNIELTAIKARGLNEEPLDITAEQLKAYRMYSLVSKDRLGDLFGLKS